PAAAAAATAATTAAPPPQQQQQQQQRLLWAPPSRHLLRTLLRTPILCATSLAPADLLMQQLEKLAANSVINPLTVLLDARNGALLYNYALTRVMRLLLSEISLVLRSLPELQHIPGVAHRFDPGRLETLVVGVANRTRENVSSMLADVRTGRRTEVEYMNGWVVRKGEEMGVQCVMNFMVKEMVKGKQVMVKQELEESVPLVGPDKGRTQDEICHPNEYVLQFLVHSPYSRLSYKNPFSSFQASAMEVLKILTD
ncbi:6-phosphogluconate dehydrogenase C-terminal domain-like protein, partial [Glonium stellatum]